LAKIRRIVGSMNFPSGRLFRNSDKTLRILLKVVFNLINGLIISKVHSNFLRIKSLAINPGLQLACRITQVFALVIESEKNGVSDRKANRILEKYQGNPS